MDMSVARVGLVWDGDGLAARTPMGLSAKRLGASGVFAEYQQARDDLHAAWSSLEAEVAKGFGPTAWAARRRYQSARRRLSQVTERLVWMGQGA